MATVNTAVWRAHFQELLPEALKWLKRLVDTNSFTANAPGVTRTAQITAEMFATLGLEAELVPSRHPDHGCHLFLRTPYHHSAGDKQPLLLVSHSDTVFPPEEEIREHFQWEEAPDERRIYGPGTVDIKGGTVLIWMMLHAIRLHAPDAFQQTPWLVAVNAAEEVMSVDFAERVHERCPYGATAVLVFEGGPRIGDQWQVVTSRKGRAEYRITAHGKAAHAGSAHDQGSNAIVTLTHAVQAAAGVTDYRAGLTVNVGNIQGGTVLNRVPHEAHAELEMRAFSPDALQAGGDALRSLDNQDAQGIGITVEQLGHSPAWAESDDSQKLSQYWVEAAALLGISLSRTPRGGLSDANYLCDLGPTLDGLGPSGGNAHCSERSADGSKLPEYVETDTFVPKALLNTLALLDWLQQGRGS